MSDHHQDSHDHDAHHDDANESSSGLGSIFVEEKLPEPIVIEAIMQDLKEREDANEPIDMNELQKHPSTRYARVMDELASSQAQDLALGREEGVVPIIPTKLHVYNDGREILSDQVDSDENIQLSREYLESSEGFLVDARTTLPHTRETMDMFVPSRSIGRKILQSLKIPIVKVVRQKSLWGSYFHRFLLLLLIIHLIGAGLFILGSWSILSLRDANTYQQRSQYSIIAKYSFGIAHLFLAPVGHALEGIPPTESIGKNFTALLRITHNSGILLREGSLLEGEYLSNSSSQDREGGIMSMLVQTGGLQTDIVKTFDGGSVHLHKMIEKAHSISADMDILKGNIAFVDATKLLTLKRMVRYFAEGGEYYLLHKDEILTAMGRNKPMRYLILNQNRDEIRASGGFPGSVIFLEMNRGAITKLESRDIYFYDWKLYPYQVEPPPGIRELTTNYGLRDANYSPVFAKNFSVINQFHERAGYESLDGIVAINQGIIEEIIDHLGGVNFPEMQTTITKENFSLYISSIVEAQIGRKDSAKDILFAFQKHFLDALRSSPHAYLDIIDETLSAIDRGEILAVWGDDSLSDLNAAFEGNARAMKDGSNWIYPVYTSLSGNKSDRYIHRSIRMTSSFAENCNASNEVALTLTHTLDDRGAKAIGVLQQSLGLTGSLLDEKVRIQGSGSNIVYTRILVPKGSSFTQLPQGATRLNVESDTPFADAIAFKIETSRGKSQIVKFAYKTPSLKSCDVTPMMIRQPGLKSVEFISGFKD
ncbi:MAG: DUF4012 domain-containing protein [Candidatus Gracilibacteria bacterium]